MTALFILFLIIDVAIAFVYFWEGFRVSSNMRSKNQKRFFLVLGVIIAALVAQYLHFQWAWVIAGIPAIIAVLYFLMLSLSFMLHKGPWH